MLISAVIDGAAATRCREATRDAPGARKAASAESTRTDANRSRDDIRSDSLCVSRSFDLMPPGRCGGGVGTCSQIVSVW